MNNHLEPREINVSDRSFRILHHIGLKYMNIICKHFDKELMSKGGSHKHNLILQNVRQAMADVQHENQELLEQKQKDMEDLKA
jgi:hypothetical protein